MRLTVLKLMLAVVAVAFGVAALRSASQLWVETLLALNSVAIGSAILAAIYREGGRRAFCLGFVLFAGGYLWLAFGSSAGQAWSPRLLTGRLFIALYERLKPPSVSDRPDLPVPAGQYLGTAIRLSEVGDVSAGRYCRVAFDYRDLLSDAERTQLYEKRELLGAGEIATLTAEHNSTPGLRLPAFRPQGTVEDFERTGHGLMGVAAGCLGGIIGLSLIHSRRPHNSPQSVVDRE